MKYRKAIPHPQCSTNLPFSNRRLSTTVMLIGRLALPERGSVPVHLLRAQTLSPFSTRSSTVRVNSLYVAAHGLDLILQDLGPGNIGLGEVCVLRQLCSRYFIGNG
jgi:hypothetical protein